MEWGDKEKRIAFYFMIALHKVGMEPNTVLKILFQWWFAGMLAMKERQIHIFVEIVLILVRNYHTEFHRDKDWPSTSPDLNPRDYIFIISFRAQGLF